MNMLATWLWQTGVLALVIWLACALLYPVWRLVKQRVLMRHVVPHCEQHFAWWTRVVYAVMHTVPVFVLLVHPRSGFGQAVAQGRPGYVAAWLVSYVATVLLYRASNTDPGFVPIGTRDVTTCSADLSDHSGHHQGGERDGNHDHDHDHDHDDVVGVVEEGQPISQAGCCSDLPETAVCSECRIERPIRSKHCKDCGRCVARFDHHCDWVGTCVGEKNHVIFWYYLVAQSILLALATHTAAMMVHLRQDDSLFQFMFNWDNILGLVIVIIAASFGVFVWPFTLWHCYLILTNQTTYETFKVRADGTLGFHWASEVPAWTLPFDRGCLANVEEFFCALRQQPGLRVWQPVAVTASSSAAARGVARGRRLLYRLKLM